MRIISVAIFVFLGLVASITLNHVAKTDLALRWWLVGYGVVYALHAARFVFWGRVLKQHDLSEVYPLTSLFFPMIYAYSVYSGESTVETNKMVGVGLILIGVFMVEFKLKKA